MRYTVQQAIGNFSIDLETFDSRDEAREYLEDRVDSELLNMASETALSYYSIEETCEPEEEILDLFYKGVYTVGGGKDARIRNLP